MAQPLLNEEIVKQVHEVFDVRLEQPVEILAFSRKQDCEYCPETLQLLDELVATSDKLQLHAYDLDEDADLARRYHVDKTPSLVLAGRDGERITDYGIRYTGVPSGYEFSSLINDIVTLSGRDSGLAVETRQALKKLTQPVLLQVFVTPT